MKTFREYVNEDATVKADLETLLLNVSKSKETTNKDLEKLIKNIINNINKRKYSDKKYLVKDCEEVKKLIADSGYTAKNITWSINNIIDFAGV